MKTIQILKNGNVIKEIICNDKNIQEKFNYACDIAGGMWNGIDKLSVKIK